LGILLWFGIDFGEMLRARITQTGIPGGWRLFPQNSNMLLRSNHPAIVPAFHGREQIQSAAEGAISPENAQAKGPWNHELGS
jgi:hypothetical protein